MVYYIHFVRGDIYMSKKKEQYSDVVDAIDASDDEFHKVQRSLTRFALVACFSCFSMSVAGIAQLFDLGIGLASFLGVSGGATVVGGLIGLKKMNNKGEEQFHKTSLATSWQILHRVEDLVDDKFVVSSKTNYFNSIIQGRLSQSSIVLGYFDTEAINQFLYLLNANYYPSVLKHFPTKHREDVIIETVDQLFTYLVQNEKNQFGERELKQFFQGYQLLSKKEKKDFLKEFRSGRYKNIHYKRNQYAVFPKEFDEDVKPISSMFQIKEEEDSYQLDLGIVLDIQQRISRLPMDAKEKYNEWLHKIISSHQHDSFGPNMELRGQLCQLFAEVEFEQKSIVNPKIYQEFFHQFSFFANSKELDSSSFERGLQQFYSMIQFLEIHKSSVDFSEFLELQGMATDIFYQLLIYHDEYSSVILNGMTDSYKNSVSIRIRERLDNLLQGKELPRDYLSIYTLNQSDIPIEQYISRGIHILRNYEDRPVISNHQEFIKANQ